MHFFPRAAFYPVLVRNERAQSGPSLVLNLDAEGAYVIS